MFFLCILNATLYVKVSCFLCTLHSETKQKTKNLPETFTKIFPSFFFISIQWKTSEKKGKLCHLHFSSENSESFVFMLQSILFAAVCKEICALLTTQSAMGESSIRAIEFNSAKKNKRFFTLCFYFLNRGKLLWSTKKISFQRTVISTPQSSIFMHYFH